MTSLLDQLAAVLPANQIVAGDFVSEDYTHDEALTATPGRPDALVRPTDTAEVSRILALADEEMIPVTARGNGTGLCGGAIPTRGGISLSFERMNRILEIDTANHVAVVQPGVTLAELDEATAPLGLICPIYPGENSATLGGNVATNAGGMRAVKYGVTRHQVLGLEVVLPGGEVIRTGGKFVKATSGYDLTQLIVGSEGTLAVVTEATLRLHPRQPHSATILAPFSTLEEVTEAIPQIVATGLDPTILEYVDMMAMAATTEKVGLELGIPDDIGEAALAYLIVVVEGIHEDRVEQDAQVLGALVTELGAMDAYVLPRAAGAKLLEAREQAFWVSKERGADDIVDVVVPRASIPQYLSKVSALAQENQALVAGAGHAGDGNVHLAVFQPDNDRRDALMHAILAAGMDLGGAVSAEHGIGTEKRSYFNDLEDPAKLALMGRIKTAFDPNGILNPDKILA